MKRLSAASDTSFVVALVAAGAVALVLRLAGTGDRTLFWDEAYHIRLVLMPTVTEMLSAQLANPPSDPLYALLLRFWASLAGTSDFILRVPSAVFGALTTTAAAWLALEVTRYRRVAVLTAVLVALAPYAVEYGQEASLYAFAALTTTLALAASWRWRRTGSKRDAALAIVLSILAVYSHYTVPVILALVAVLSLTRLGGARAVSARHVAGLVAIVLVAWLPWLLPMLGAWADADLARTSLVRHAALSELAGALSQYASGTGALLERVRPLQVIGLVVGGALLVRGWVVGGAPERGGLRVITVATALYFFVPWLISAITGLWLFVAHMMLFVLPAVAVVLAAGALVRDAPLRALAPAAAAILIAAQVWGLAVNAANPPHGDDGSRDLAVALAARHADDQPVLIVPNEQQIIFERYWSGPLAALPQDLDMRRLYRVADPTADLAALVERFDSAVGDSQQAWLVYTPAREADAMFLEGLARDWNVALVEERFFGRLYELTRR